MKRIVAGFAFAGVALIAGTAMAQQMNRYERFDSAQRLIDDTIERVESVRREGRERFDGHAAKAEALLRQAQAELSAAAEYRARHD